MSQEWPRPVPQHVEWAPATPTGLQVRKEKPGQSQPRKACVLRMWAEARTQRPRPHQAGWERAPGQLSPAQQLFLWRPKRPD